MILLLFSGLLYLKLCSFVYDKKQTNQNTKHSNHMLQERKAVPRDKKYTHGCLLWINTHRSFPFWLHFIKNTTITNKHTTPREKPKIQTNWAHQHLKLFSKILFKSVKGLAQKIHIITLTNIAPHLASLTIEHVSSYHTTPSMKKQRTHHIIRAQ